MKKPTKAQLKKMTIENLIRNHGEAGRSYDTREAKLELATAILEFEIAELRDMLAWGDLNKSEDADDALLALDQIQDARLRICHGE